MPLDNFVRPGADSDPLGGDYQCTVGLTEYAQGVENRNAFRCLAHAHASPHIAALMVENEVTNDGLVGAWGEYHLITSASKALDTALSEPNVIGFNQPKAFHWL